MNYNKPTIPKGTCSNFNFSYLFCIDIQSITKTYAPFILVFCALLNALIMVYIGTFR